MAFGKNSDVEITRPLKHRPGVKVFKLNGTYKVMGDGGLYTPEEFVLLHGGYAESTTPRLQFTDSEQAEIDAAEDCLTRASALVDKLYEDGRRLDEKFRTAYRSATVNAVGMALNEEQQEVVRELEAQAHELRGRIERSSKLESHALVKRNEVTKRITTAARERLTPLKIHNPQGSLDDQLADLEGK